MAITSKRLFVGNLFEGVTEDELKQRFNKFGDVSKVEVKVRNHDDGVIVTFAFIDVEISEVNLTKCFNIYNKTTWKGKEIRLQLAKDSFLTRLEQEREESQGEMNKCSTDSKIETLPQQKNEIWKPHRLNEPVTTAYTKSPNTEHHKYSTPINQARVKNSSVEDVCETAVNESEPDVCNGIPMFRGSGSVPSSKTDTETKLLSKKRTHRDSKNKLAISDLEMADAKMKKRQKACDPITKVHESQMDLNVSNEHFDYKIKNSNEENEHLNEKSKLRKRDIRNKEGNAENSGSKKKHHKKTETVNGGNDCSEPIQGDRSSGMLMRLEKFSSSIWKDYEDDPGYIKKVRRKACEVTEVPDMEPANDFDMDTKLFRLEDMLSSSMTNKTSSLCDGVPVKSNVIQGILQSLDPEEETPRKVFKPPAIGKRALDAKHALSERKRQAAFEERLAEKSKQKIAIQQALAAIDKPLNKKIKFETEDMDDDLEQETKEKAKGMRLFDDDDDVSGDGEELKTNPLYETAAGHRVLELQSRFPTTDERFKLDKRFLDEEADAGAPDDCEDDEMSLEQEKQRNLRILEKIFGAKTVDRYGVESYGITHKGRPWKNTEDMRYDPSNPNPEHEKYVKKSQPVKIEQKPAVESELPKERKEKFYEVSDTLVSSFKNSKPFSLLQAYGQDFADVKDTDKRKLRDEDDVDQSASIKGDFKPYNSDDDDGDDGAGEVEVKPASVCNPIVKVGNQSYQNGPIDTNMTIPDSSQEPTTLFIQRIDDPRLKRGVAFFQRKESLEVLRERHKSERPAIYEEIAEIQKRYMRRNAPNRRKQRYQKYS